MIADAIVFFETIVTILETNSNRCVIENSEFTLSATTLTKFILSFGSRKKNPFELSKKELTGFIAGDFMIKDPEGDLIKYTELSDGMKPKPSDLEAFINS